MINILHIGEHATGGGDGTVFRSTVLALKQAPFGDRYRNHVACRQSEGLPFAVDLDMGPPRPEAVLSAIYSRGNYRKLQRFLLRVRPDIIHLQHYANLSPSILHAIYGYKRQHRDVHVVQTTHTFERVCPNFAGYDFRLGKRCTDCAADRFRYRIFRRRCSRGGTLHSWGKGLAALIADFFYDRGVVDSVIAPSEFLGRIMQPRIGNLSAMYTIGNPIADVFLDSATRPAHKQDLVVAFGRLSEEKNYPLLIEALVRYKRQYHHLKPLTVKIIGEGAEQAKLQALAIENGLDFVWFTPFLGHEQLVQAIGSAKVSVLPSKCFETFALFVIESLALNIIPLVAGHGGMREAVERFGAGVTFRSEDPQDLADRLFLCLENYPERIQLLTAAGDRIKETFSSDRYADALKEVYGNRKPSDPAQAGRRFPISPTEPVTGLC
ncbi:glycosyltransferase family 4 protein [Parapedobacter sp. DT-150]|uniref:glycosyltransferase family 4 protein n=1 Tax=Parapedobacter sp. DT-150 TaxID=3396162 RepID=UPI003F1A122B